MKKAIPIILGLILIAILGIIIYKNSSREDNNIPSTKSVIKEKQTNTIEEIKKEVNATADTNMYHVEEEYDGRKILQIKPDIQYDTVLAGILKNGKPKEIEEILKNRPTKSGIWVAEQCRQNFLKLLKDNNLNGYEIDKQGYLIQNNGNNDKLNKTIKSDKLFIIDMSGKCYTRDEISGEIIEYPFEEMDPYQILEKYDNSNSSIIVVTTNSRRKISNKEIFEEILLNLE